MPSGETLALVVIVVAISLIGLAALDSTERTRARSKKCRQIVMENKELSNDNKLFLLEICS